MTAYEYLIDLDCGHWGFEPAPFAGYQWCPSCQRMSKVIACMRSDPLPRPPAVTR